MGRLIGRHRTIHDEDLWLLICPFMFAPRLTPLWQNAPAGAVTLSFLTRVFFWVVFKLGTAGAALNRAIVGECWFIGPQIPKEIGAGKALARLDALRREIYNRPTPPLGVD
jgi:hypothetical protein